MIEIIALASAVVTWLAPTLPYLVKGTEEAAKSFGKELGAGAFEKAKELYHLLRPAIESKPAAKEAVTDASEAPNDKVVLSALELQIRKILTEDSALASHVQTLVTENSPVGSVIAAYGARSIAVSTVSSGTFITGDHNTGGDQHSK